MLPNSLRQLLLQLASVHGDIFEDDSQRQAYASFIVEGAMAVLASPLAPAGARTVWIPAQGCFIWCLVKGMRICERPLGTITASVLEICASVHRRRLKSEGVSNLKTALA